MRKFLAFLCIFLTSALPAVAAPKRHSDKPGGVERAWAGIQSVSLHDLQYAHALAGHQGAAPGAAERARCYEAWMSLVVGQQGADAALRGMKLAPKAQKTLAAKFELLAQKAAHFRKGSPFMVACHPVAKQMGLSVLKFVLLVARQ